MLEIAGSVHDEPKSCVEGDTLDASPAIRFCPARFRGPGDLAPVTATAACVIARDPAALLKSVIKPSAIIEGAGAVTGVWLLTNQVEAWEAEAAALSLEAHLGADRVTAVRLTKAQGILLGPCGAAGRTFAAISGPQSPTRPRPLWDLLDEDWSPPQVATHALPALLALEDEQYAVELRREITRQRVRQDAREGSARRFALPPDAEMSIAEKAALPHADIEPLVGSMHADGFNTVIVGRPKSGKSTLALNLAKALLDGEDLFGIPTSLSKSECVGYLNFEMTAGHLRSEIHRMGLRNGHRLFELSMREQSVRLDGPAGVDIAAWCRRHGISVLIVDALRRVFKGESENDNAEMDRTLQGLDELKQRAGVRNLFLIAHAGRVDGSRARGASNVDAWADSIWTVEGKDLERRKFQASGRHDQFGPIALEFHRETNCLRVAGPDARPPDRNREHLMRALAALADGPLNAREWRRAIKGHSKHRQPAMDEAKRLGLVSAEAGPQNSVLHELTEAGHRALQETAE